MFRLLALAALLLASCGGPYTYRGGPVDPPTKAYDFTLTRDDGAPFTLSQQTGKVTLLFFGFTHCPDVCPTALADVAAVRRKLGPAAKDVQLAFISIDPARDTPQVMANYVHSFDPTFIGLSATQAQLDPILAAYGASATRRDLPGSALGYTMDHTAFTYLIDQRGNWRLIFEPGMSVEDMTSDVAHVVQSGGAA